MTVFLLSATDHSRVRKERDKRKNERDQSENEEQELSISELLKEHLSSQPCGSKLCRIQCVIVCANAQRCDRSDVQVESRERKAKRDMKIGGYLL